MQTAKASFAWADVKDVIRESSFPFSFIYKFIFFFFLSFTNVTPESLRNVSETSLKVI